MSDEPQTKKISGKKIQLDDARHVFVGLCDDDPRNVYVEFRNSDGELTKLAISSEACDALVTLLHAVNNQERWEVVS